MIYFLSGLILGIAIGRLIDLYNDWYQWRQDRDFNNWYRKTMSDAEARAEYNRVWGEDE